MAAGLSTDYRADVESINISRRGSDDDVDGHRQLVMMLPFEDMVT